MNTPRLNKFTINLAIFVLIGAGSLLLMTATTEAEVPIYKHHKPYSGTAPSTDKPPLIDIWKERFQDVMKLNKHAAKLPVEISNTAIEGFDLSGAVLRGGIFRDTDWKKVKGTKLHIENLTFRNGIFVEVEFERSHLHRVTFENITFYDGSFVLSTLQDVRFIECKFHNTTFQELKPSQITIERSELKDVYFADASLTATILNSKLTGVALTALQPPSSLKFENSELDHVNLSWSKLGELMLDNVKTLFVRLNKIEANKVTFLNSELNLGLSESKVKSLIINNSHINMHMVNTQLPDVRISNCVKVEDLGLYGAKIGQMQVTNCSLDQLDLARSTADNISILKSLIIDSDFNDMKVKRLSLEDVTLDLKIDFTNAHVDQLNVKNINKLPQLQLITTGSNVRL